MSVHCPTHLAPHKHPKNTLINQFQLPSPFSMRPGKMHGFLCQSQASTAVCIPGDSRSAIVPRRPDRTLIGMDQHRHHVDWKYSRLGEPRRFSTSSRPEKRFHAVANASRVAKREKTTTTPTITTTDVVPSKSTTIINVPSKAITLVPPPLPPTHGEVFQVVVMRVSIHCQGCAGKVKKHISKMEGVTSFSIDLESKRVTVMGHISPVGVLESISKIKKAEFWHSK